MEEAVERKSARAWVTIDPALNKRLKIYAVTHDTQVRALVEEAVTRHLDALEKGGSRKD